MLKASERVEDSFSKFIEDFLRPFRFRIEERKLEIEIEEYFEN